MVEMCWVGLPSEPAEFVKRRVEAGHPRGFRQSVIDPSGRCLKGGLEELKFEGSLRKPSKPP